MNDDNHHEKDHCFFIKMVRSDEGDLESSIEIYILFINLDRIPFHMKDEEEQRLETACRCLDLPRPDPEEWLSLTDEQCIIISNRFKAFSDPIRIKIIDMLRNGHLYD